MASRSSSPWPRRGWSARSRSATVFTLASARSKEAFLYRDDVAGVHRRLLGHALGRLGLVVLADHEDLVLGGALLEAAGQRHGLAHREPRDVGIAAGPLDLAVDVEIAILDDRD